MLEKTSKIAEYKLWQKKKKEFLSSIHILF